MSLTFIISCEDWGLVSRLLDDHGISIVPLDTNLIKVAKVVWARFACRNGKSSVILARASVPDYEDSYIILLSLDMRRLLLPWKVLGDLTLLWQIIPCLKLSGASKFDPAKTRESLKGTSR